MPNYRYQIRTSSGQVQTGVIGADTAGAASTLLRNQGAHVLALAAIAGADVEKTFFERLKELNQGRPSQKHVLDFTTQLAVMIRAGINLRSALDGIGEQTTHPGFKRILQQLKTDVEAGK